MKRRGWFSILVAVLLVATLLIFLISFQVRVNEVALVFRFGKVTRAITLPGLYWKLPYPVETVQRYDARIKVSWGKFDEVYTADGKNLVLTTATGWSIDDPKIFYANVQTVANAESQIQSRVGSVRNAVVAKHAFGDFVSTDPQRLALHQIEEEIKEKVQDDARNFYGVRMHFVLITQLGLPQKVTEKVFQRMTAERGRIAKKYRSEGLGKADQIRAEADRDRALVLSDAERDATGLRGEGDAAAEKYYAEFEKNPELAIFLRQLDTLRKLKERTTYILDTTQPPYNLLRANPSIPGIEPLEGKSPAPKGDVEPKLGKEKAPGK